MEWKKPLGAGVVLLSSLFLASCGASGPKSPAAALIPSSSPAPLTSPLMAPDHMGLSPAASAEPVAKTVSGQEHSRVIPWRFDALPMRLPGYDGTELSSILYVPKGFIYPGPRPVLIFVNSWASDENEYDGQARQFADAGYLVLSYATRGFGTSDGLVTVAGPDDIKDVSALINWLGNNMPADTSHIGMAGISYGAGIALLAAGHDPRIQAVAAMSGWGNLKTAIYGNDTLRQVWTALLVGSGALTGRLSPEIYQQVLRLENHIDIPELTAWAAERSPESVVTALNARHVAVYLANSYEDNLFPPAQIGPFFTALTGPKLFAMDRGIHAMSALPGLAGFPSDIWNDVHDWMDQYVRGMSTDVMAHGPVSFKLGGDREIYAALPPLDAREHGLPLHLMNQKTTLLQTPSSTTGLPTPGADPGEQLVELIGSIDSGATSGIPLVSDTADAALNIKVIEPIDAIDQRYAVLYTTPQLARSIKLRGSARVTLPLAPNDGPSQFVAYLYDVDEMNLGTLVSYGVMTRYAPIESPENIILDLGIIAYDIPAGHTLVVAVDTRDPLYMNPQAAQYRVVITESTRRGAQLDLPVVR